MYYALCIIECIVLFILSSKCDARGEEKLKSDRALDIGIVSS